MELLKWSVRFEAYTLLSLLNSIELKDAVKLLQKRSGFHRLHLSALGGYSDLIAVILKDEDVNINEKSESGDSALHLASLQDNSITVDLLLKNGANYMDKNRNGLFPMHIAAENGNKIVLRIIFEKYIIDKKLYENQSREHSTERLLNIEDSFKNSVLHHAAIKDNLDVTKLILNYGKVNIFKANINDR